MIDNTPREIKIRRSTPKLAAGAVGSGVMSGTQIRRGNILQYFGTEWNIQSDAKC